MRNLCNSIFEIEFAKVVFEIRQVFLYPEIMDFDNQEFKKLLLLFLEILLFKQELMTLPLFYPTKTRDKTIKETIKYTLGYPCL